MQTRVRSLDQEDPLEKATLFHTGYPLQYACLENPTKGACWATVHRAAKIWTRLGD